MSLSVSSSMCSCSRPRQPPARSSRYRSWMTSTWSSRHRTASSWAAQDGGSSRGPAQRPCRWHEGGVKGFAGFCHVGHPRHAVGVLRMCPVSQGVQEFFVSGKTTGIFQRPAHGTVNQPGRRRRLPGGPAGYQLKLAPDRRVGLDQLHPHVQDAPGPVRCRYPLVLLHRTVLPDTARLRGGPARGLAQGSASLRVSTAGWLGNPQYRNSSRKKSQIDDQEPLLNITAHTAAPAITKLAEKG
jgi:hypothetical protein